MGRAAVLAALGAVASPARAAEGLTFLFTSDVHFGITRNSFRGEANVSAARVNAALVRTLNAMPGAVLPDDGGIAAGRAVGPIAFLAITGDLASRQELYPIHIQPAAASWREFASVYLDGLHLRDAAGQPTRLCLMPGNHDVSNAIGHPNKLVPARDATAMAEIYNRMMHPAELRTAGTYNYETDKINYSADVGGVHAVFLTMWPDTRERAWLEGDLAAVAATTPVFLFCHDHPDVDTRHLINPNGAHDVNGQDRFENVVSDISADGPSAEAPSLVEQRALVAFLKRHRNIVAYFHGHNNWTEFYTWHGPDGDIDLKVFRTDSPMKGRIGAADETKLAFELVSVAADATQMTVRECLWNVRRGENPPERPVDWGLATTVSLQPRSR